jgi:hypothetical protein
VRQRALDEALSDCRANRRRTGVTVGAVSAGKPLETRAGNAESNDFSVSASAGPCDCCAETDKREEADIEQQQRDE